MSKVLVGSRVVLGLAGAFAVAVGGQGCSSSSSSSSSSANDSGAEDTGTGGVDSGGTQPVDSGGTQPVDSGSTTSHPDSGSTTLVEASTSWSPSNVPAGALAGLAGVAVDVGNLGNSCTFDTGTGTLQCNTSATVPTPMGMQITQNGGAVTAYVWVLSSLTLESGTALDFTGPRPAILVISGTASIGGAITTEAGEQQENGTPDNAESGAACNVSGSPESAGSGGGFCGAGGTGANGFDAGSVPGGAPYGTASLTPLVSGGAGGYCNGGGEGGGALQISAGTIAVQQGGSIEANGYAGGYSGGGGAGGAILLEAPSVTIGGTLAANGGSGGDSTSSGNNANVSVVPAGGGGTNGGQGSAAATISGGNGLLDSAATNYGGGGGGAGYIRINTNGQPAVASAGGVVSPSNTTCYTVGALP